MLAKQDFQQFIQSFKTKNVRLIAVSKFKPASDILTAYEYGQKDFGENYVQELVTKQEQLPADIHWHFIGHLQTNKVKYIAPFVHLIHTVDSFKLLKEINKQAEKNKRVISCLLQMRVTDEDSKSGMNDKELLELMSFYQAQKAQMENVKIVGIMGMATNTDDQNQIHKDFQELKTIFNFAANSYFPLDKSFQYLSMGMSGDYEIALEEGSNMVRIGRRIFGERPTKQS